MFLRNIYHQFKQNRLNKSLGHIGAHSSITFPVHLSQPQLIYLDDYVRILNDFRFIGNKGKFIVKKYTGISTNLTVVTDNHKPTVGIPYFFTGTIHINDVSKDVIVKEDCWIGTNVTLLPGCVIGRGSIVAACALANKEYPPYAILAGIPAKIIGCKFSIEQILQHEKSIYPKEERMSKEELEILFSKYYKNCPPYGTSYLSASGEEQYIQLLKQYNLQPSDFQQSAASK